MDKEQKTGLKCVTIEQMGELVIRCLRQHGLVNILIMDLRLLAAEKGQSAEKNDWEQVIRDYTARLVRQLCQESNLNPVFSIERLQQVLSASLPKEQTPETAFALEHNLLIATTLLFVAREKTRFYLEIDAVRYAIIATAAKLTILPA